MKYLLVLFTLLGFGFSAARAQSGYGMYDAIPITINTCSGSSFTDYQYTPYFSNNYGNSAPDVWYTFTITAGTDVYLSTCGSNFDTYLWLTDQYGNAISTDDDGGCGGGTSEIYQYLSPGTYYVVAEGYSYNSGNLTLNLTTYGSGTPADGAGMSYAINAGAFSSSGTFTDTRSNADDCLGNNIGQAGNDIYYTFTLNSTANVSINHCGSGFDTYMHLLDAYGNVITYNDDSSVSPCPGNQAYIESTLSAGTYYVVSEGYGAGTGNIVTSINISMGALPVPVISYTASSTFAMGAAITPLSPINTGGAVSSGGQSTITLAGGSQGSANGSGASAQFNLPTSAAVDASGNIYIGDSGNNMVRKISPSGVVTTLAGNGAAGSTDGTGAGASFNHPAGMAVDASGNIYVSDQYSNTVRKVSPAGVVSTFVGSGAGLNNPLGLVFDQSGNLYVADYANNLIRKVSPSGVLSTFAGSGATGYADGTGTAASFNRPMGLAVDAAGNIYVGDRLNHRVRKISPAGVVTTLAGSGTGSYADGIGTAASFNRPCGVAVDAAGNVLVTDELNAVIRMIDPSGNVSTVAGSASSSGIVNGTGSTVRFMYPYAIALDATGNAYVVELTGHAIRKMTIAKAYSISPALPAGLTFNENTGVISGTPTAVSAAATYTVTAYNSYGTGTTTLSIEVSGSCITPSLDQNYVISYVPRESGLTTTSAVVAASCNPAMVQTGIQYYDGLGRPMQSVQVKGSAAADKDVVVPMAYDEFGREAMKYLPYASTTNNGTYKADGLTAVTAYYAAQPAGQATAFSTPFARTMFEPSPLNRVLEQGAPGDVWQPSASRTTTAGRTVVTEYGSNIASDVKLWTVSGSGATAGYYDANKLYKTTVKDENWVPADVKAGTTDEYKDLEGRVVLKRVWETDTKGLSTYYVYDDLGNLRYVLPPAVNENSDRMTAINGFTEADDLFKQFIYGYHYDGRKRMTEKKIPGKDWEFMVYNSLDQVVLSQDWKQRSEGKWLFNKYDAFGNVIITGLYNDGSGRAALQSTVDGLVSSNPNYKWWEEPSGSGVGYTNNVFPQTINYYHSINYYGNYSFPGNVFGAPNAGLGQVAVERTKDLLTGSSVTVLGTGSMLLTVNYYDAEGRVVQSKSQHYKNNVADANNYDELSNVYSFTGELKESTRKHYNNGTEALYVYNEYAYDHMGRKLSTKQKTGVNSGTGNALVTLSANGYNEIGQLSQKGLHNGLQSSGLYYNERGWLARSESPEFSFKLLYQDGTTAQYNGNIANQGLGAGSAYSNNFTYGYDKLNRLENGTGGGMSEILTYDVMGNIKSMNRDGAGANAYSYTGNRLDGVAGLTGAYIYNENGNATYDGRTHATIDYNYLNLPSTVTLPGSNLSYLYDAGGRKLRKTSSTTGTVDYVDGIHYKPDGSIDFLQTEVGLARRSGTDYNYEYTLSDHLGNARYSFDIYGGAIRRIQQQDYYPFGKINESGQYVFGEKNKYLYNSKELQEELGQLDYGARFYDPEIGRWNVVDPLTELDRMTTPYAYAFDDPIRHTDPDGMFGEDAVEDVNQEGPKPKAAVVVGLTFGNVLLEGAKGYLKGYALAIAAPSAAVLTAVLVFVPQNGTGAGSDNPKPYFLPPPMIPPGLKKENQVNAESGGREGKDFTRKGKQEVIDGNKKKNDGKTVCEGCKVETTKPEKSRKGVTPPKTDTQVDHKKPKSKGGSGTPDNGQVLCRDCNIKKSNKGQRD